MKLQLRFLVVFALFVAPLAGRAQTVIASTYNGTTPGGVPALGNIARTGSVGVYTGLSAGESFITNGQSYTFNSVVANMLMVTGSSSDLTAGIYSDSSGTPGTLLASLNVPAISALTQNNYTFTS